MIVSTKLLLFGLVAGTNQYFCNGLVTPNHSPFSHRPYLATLQASRPLHLLGTPVSDKDNDIVSDIDSEEIFVITFPLITMTLAFLTYDDTARMFHDFVVAASGGLELVE